MRFAQWSFRIAGVWGLLAIPPMYFLERQVGLDNPPPITHAEFFYGFVGVTLAWQFAFLVISRDPVRHRPLMWPAMLEKFTFVGAVVVLYVQQRLPNNLIFFGSIDLLLGVLFVVSFFRTSPRSLERG